MRCRDKLGWPVELIEGRPVTNFIRLLIHTSLWQTWLRRGEALSGTPNAMIGESICERPNRLKVLERENAALRKLYEAGLETWNPVYEEILNANAALRAELERVRKDAEAMKAATYSHVDGRDLLHQLQPNGAHHIDILVRINGQDRRYQGDWLKKLTWARDGHNMGEYADNPQLRALIEQRRKEGPQEVGVCCGSIDAAIAQGKGEK